LEGTCSGQISGWCSAQEIDEDDEVIKSAAMSEGWSKDNWPAGAVIAYGAFGSILAVCPVLQVQLFLRRKYGKNWEDDSALIDGTLLEKQEKMETRMGDVVATRREISYMFDLGNQQGTVYVPKIEVPQPIFIQIGDPGSEIQVRRNTKNPLLHQLEIEAPKQTKIPDKAAIITNAVLLGIVFLAGLFVATVLQFAISENVVNMAFGALVMGGCLLPIFPPYGFWRDYVQFPLDWRPAFYLPFLLRQWVLRKQSGAKGRVVPERDLHKIPKPGSWPMLGPKPAKEIGTQQAESC
jgi:hypothetical protein